MSIFIQLSFGVALITVQHNSVFQLWSSKSKSSSVFSSTLTGAAFASSFFYGAALTGAALEGFEPPVYDQLFFIASTNLLAKAYQANT